MRDALNLPADIPADVTAAIAAAHAEGVTAGRAALLEEVAAYNNALDVVDEAQEAEVAATDALSAETETSKKPALEKALERAKLALKAAEDAAAELKPAA